MTTLYIYCINTSEKSSFVVEQTNTEKLAKKLFQTFNKTWSQHYCKSKQIKLDEINCCLSCIRYCFSDSDQLSYEACNKQYLKQIKEM